MAVYRLDRNGKPIRQGSKLRQASKHVAGVLLYHWQLKGRTAARKHYMRNVWLRTREEAEEADLRLRSARSSAVPVTWSQAWRRYQDDPDNAMSDGHRQNMQIDVEKLVQCIGDIPLEETTLAQYTEFLDSRKGGSGRAAQLAWSHTRTIAKWLAGKMELRPLRFLVATRPKGTLKKKKPCPPEVFWLYVERLPDLMRPLWMIIGVTGARITGMANVREPDILAEYLTVTTKGQKQKTYPCTPLVQAALKDARAVKALYGLNSAYLFVNSRGNRWNHRTYHDALERFWRAEAERTQHGGFLKRELKEKKKKKESVNPIAYTPVPRFTPHQLRHMIGTMAAATNQTPDGIKAILGHADRRTAEGYIDDTDPEMLNLADAGLAAVSDHLIRFTANLPQFRPNIAEIYGNVLNPDEPKVNETPAYECPCCKAKLLLHKEKGLIPREE